MARGSVRVRPADACDVAELVELVRASRAASAAHRVLRSAERGPDSLTERFTYLIADPIRTVLVAVDDSAEARGALVGVLVARPDEVATIEALPVLHITHLVVAAGQRRRGIGRVLMAAAVHVADECGYERVLATAFSSSREANRYLARLGFAPLVVDRIASTANLRRALGIADGPQRAAVLRKARLAALQRAPIRQRARGA